MGLPEQVPAERIISKEEVLGLLLAGNFLTEIDVERVKKAWQFTKDHPLNLITKITFPDRNNPGKSIPHDAIFNYLAQCWGITYQRVDMLNIALDVVGALLPHAYAKRLGIVPIEVTDGKVIIMVAEPFATAWISEVKPLLKKQIELRLGSPSQISHMLNEMFVVQKAFREIRKEQGSIGNEKARLLRQGKLEELDKLIEKNKGRKLSAQDGLVSSIVDWLINFASLERASDIHLEPKKGLGLVRFRIDGDLRTVYRLDHEALQMVIARFKILAEMKLDEKRRPQDGGLKRTLENGRQVEMRLSTLPLNHGEKLVVRIFDKAATGQDLSFIGFHPEDLKTWEHLISQPQGLILVTGPTGSGKTTTLYTSLSKVATPDMNVCTAEDPIEMEVDKFNQVQINPLIGLNFAECIRAFLRQDPDIIMVGEIRDFETGEMAIQSSLTGHLVFSTLHTNGALATIQRMLDLGLPAFLLNSSLTGILAQRLVKKLCTHCKKEVPADPNKWETLLDGEELPMPATYFEAQGCEECKHTGYSGRICVYELLKYDERFKKVIHEKIEISQLREKTRHLYSSIRINGARKIVSGETSLEEVLKVVY